MIILTVDLEQLIYWGVLIINTLIEWWRQEVVVVVVAVVVVVVVVEAMVGAATAEPVQTVQAV